MFSSDVHHCYLPFFVMSSCILIISVMIFSTLYCLLFGSALLFFFFRGYQETAYLKQIYAHIVSNTELEQNDQVTIATGHW